MAGMFVVICLGLALVGQGMASIAQVPDPCSAIPSSDVLSAFHVSKMPRATLSVVNTVQTCVYGQGQLTVSIGYSVIANPALPVTSVTVSGLPHGVFRTYSDSSQTEITFYTGTAATGVYGVVRNFAKIPKSKLITVAKALYAAMAEQTGGTGGTGSTSPSVNLIAP